MVENKNLSCIKTYELIQQTPIIHFQHNQAGATLRATEVKPKLDKFIIKKLCGVDLLNKEKSNWFIAGTNALNYKMQIKATSSVEFFNLGYKKDTDNAYEIYYGNMGDGPKKCGVKCNSKMTIICMNETLLKKLDECVAEFFILHNFGTMQDKGFGSYFVKNQNYNETDIAKVLKDYYGSEKCYVFPGGNYPFRRIKTIYSLMKSGLNFGSYQRSLLFLFAHKDEYKLGNEKAWLKKEEIGPILSRNGKDNYEDKNDNHDHFYVRALLGVCDKAEWLNDLNDRKNKAIINISSCDGKKIERLQSPILFKVINGKVYYVARRIDERIYGAQFEFKSKTGNGKLCVPDKNNLGDDFIDKFLAYCKTELNNGILNKYKDTNGIKIEEM